MPAVSDNVGYDSLDDAAVYHLPDGKILIQSVDFFTPIVDDAYTFGQIAAVNSLSDIYAMGGRPMFALNVAGFPSDELPNDILADILKGAESVAGQVGIPVLGGHTVKDKEPKFGWVVTGDCPTGKLLRNSTAQPGDVLVLTKPLGIGIITTAIKKDLASDAQVDTAIQVMKTLNRAAAETLLPYDAHACTDITGFGLLGHLLEMCSASGVTARLNLETVPFISGVLDLVYKNIVPGGTRKNLKFVQPKVGFSDRISAEDRLMLSDAQTSGGLLISLPESDAAEYCNALAEHQPWQAAVIGKMEDAGDLKIIVE